jgi:hypothetical protein
MQQVLDLLKAARVNSDVIARAETLFMQTRPVMRAPEDNDSDYDNRRSRTRTSRRSVSRSRAASVSRGTGFGSSRSKSPSRVSVTANAHNRRSKSPANFNRQVHRSRSPGPASRQRSRSRGRRSGHSMERDDNQSLISSVSTHKVRPTMLSPEQLVNAVTNSSSPILSPVSHSMQLSGAEVRASALRNTLNAGGPSSPATKSIQANQGIPSPMQRQSSAKQYAPHSPSSRSSQQALQHSLQFQPPRRQLSQQNSTRLASPAAGIHTTQTMSPSLSIGPAGVAPSPGGIRGPGHGAAQARPLPSRSISQQMPASRIFSPSAHNNNPSNGGSALDVVDSSNRKKSDPNFWAFF